MIAPPIHYRQDRGIQARICRLELFLCLDRLRSACSLLNFGRFGLRPHPRQDQLCAGGHRRAGNDSPSGSIGQLTTHTLEGIINENVVPGSTISTDEWRAYQGLRHAYNHGVVNHRDTRRTICEIRR